MQWIILVGDDNLNLERFEKIKYSESKYIRKADETENRLVIDYEDGYVFFDYVPEIINDYEEEDLEQLIKIVPFKAPHFIMLTYSSKEILERVLKEENFPKNLYVDDDYGAIMQIDKFVDMLDDWNN